MNDPRPSQSQRAQCRFCEWVKVELGWAGRSLLMFACLIGLGHAGHAQTSLSEYQVKALFLFNFAKYVEWPAGIFSGPHAPITIGMVGTSPCAQYLQKAVEGKNVSEHPIDVRQVEKAEEMCHCQILFIGDSEKKRVGEILSGLKNRPVLTVGESEHFAQEGGVIGFVKKEGKVRLEIDLKAARDANIEISSKLLSVADSVTGKK